MGEGGIAGAFDELDRRTSSSQKKRKRARTCTQVNVALIGMSRVVRSTVSSHVLRVPKS